jgi:hypothetical protein
MYLAGCNGTMIGNYLTTEGRSPEVDIQEIRDLGLAPKARGAGRGGKKREERGDVGGGNPVDVALSAQRFALCVKKLNKVCG